MSEEDYSHDASRHDRVSRNSRAGKEEFIAPLVDEPEEKAPAKDPKKLMIYFIAMVFIGLGNKVFVKLETIPMHNYPNFLNLFTTFIFVPVCFAYIIPMARKGVIPKEQLDMPQKPFVVMGGLDAVAGIMQVFATTYLPGPLVILLSQAAIPVSMCISYVMLKARYNNFQYIGALIVAGGIIIVLAPNMEGGSAIWAILMLLSTIPMTLSSVYKEIALGETELDAMYLNGMIAVWQLLFSVILCVPMSQVSDPPIGIDELPQNLLNGAKCLFGVNSLNCADDEGDDCVSDECNPQGPIFVWLYVLFNQGYNLLILLILKFGSANILWMAMTLMVPLGNVAFTLPSMPERQSLAVTDIVGLIVICSGLGIYRFAHDAYLKYKANQEVARDSKDHLKALLSDADDIIESTGGSVKKN